jgi:hypothetical protein
LKGQEKSKKRQHAVLVVSLLTDPAFPPTPSVITLHPFSPFVETTFPSISRPRLITAQMYSSNKTRNLNVIAPLHVKVAEQKTGIYLVRLHASIPNAGGTKGGKI